MFSGPLRSFQILIYYSSNFFIFITGFLEERYSRREICYWVNFLEVTGNPNWCGTGRICVGLLLTSEPVLTLEGEYSLTRVDRLRCGLRRSVGVRNPGSPVG